MIPNATPKDELDALLRALESAGIGCTVVVDDDRTIERVYANEPIARIFGLDVDAMRAVPPMDLLAPEERSRLATLRGSLAGKPGPALIETSILKK